MPPNRKAKLEQDLEYLKELIQTHFDYQDVLWENKEAEFEEYINAMLDYYIELRKELNALNSKKDNHGNSKR